MAEGATPLASCRTREALGRISRTEKLFSGAAQRAVGTYAWRMDLNLFPNPDMPIELGVPDFDFVGRQRAAGRTV